MRLAEFQGRRVAVWGYGREGKATLSVLRARFPAQSITLFCNEAEAALLPFSHREKVPKADEGKALQFGNAMASRETFPLSGAPRHLPPAGEGKLSIVTALPGAVALSCFDVVIKSPGISAYKPEVIEAEKAGVRFTSASAIWFAENPQAKTICVTGTKGKSTVTALIAHLLRSGGKRVALAGNIGMPLLELLDVEREPDWWVIELSSFQTRDFTGTPTVAVINNVYEDHLDWHSTRANYVADKLRIATSAQRVVVNAAQPELLALAKSDAHYAFNRAEGWHVRDGAVWLNNQRVLECADIPLPGEHNAFNVCAALAAIDAAGENARLLANHVATFKALPHRLQPLGARDGIDYINDSISTTPYAAIEALRSVGEQRATILVGGHDRGVDWQPFVEFVSRHPPNAIVTMGANGEAIAATLGKIAQPVFQLAVARTLSEAFTRAKALTQAGGVILLSPGAPSFDAFKDYTERGREFVRLAGFDPSGIAQIAGLGIA
jgi:UDP-N-acetylmuramoylalanine--D-glutamate ligase